MTVNEGYTDMEFAVFSARKLVDEAVFNMASHEGNPFTFVEVKTLLDGVTVGGHRLSDEMQILRLRRAWDELIRLVESESFDLSKDTALRLHAVVGEREALEWGVFRSRSVRISGTDYSPPDPTELDKRYDALILNADAVDDRIDRAIGMFLGCARNQFFFDCNKRIGQFLMNGVLLSNAQHIVTIPAKDKLEYDQHMLSFYDTGKETEVRQFLKQRQIDFAKRLDKP